MLMKLLGKTATALLLMVYIAAFVGFRLHECTVDHTVEILSVLADDDCEEVHHHHCHDEAHCGHHHHHCHQEDADAHEDGSVQIGQACCCANSLYFISDAQITSDGGDDFACSKCLPVAFAPVAVDAAHLSDCGFIRISYDDCRILKGCTALALYSVRRV